MGPAIKWIGGATLGVLLVLGSAVVADQALEAMAPAPQRPALALAEPVALAAPTAKPKPDEPFVINACCRSTGR